MNLGMYKEDVVAMRMPNGVIKVVKGSADDVGRVFESAEQFYSMYQRIDESTGKKKEVLLLDSILG